MRNDHCPETRPRSIEIEESTVMELRELCHQMSNSSGMVTAYLTLGLLKNSDSHLQVMEGALNLSIKGTEALRKLMLRVGILEESLSTASSTARCGTFSLGNDSRR